MAVVLIVEDETQVRMLAESILQETGHETRSAGTTAEALAILETDEKIDLLFTDITLMDEQEAGLGLGQVTIKKRPGLPVLYTTGRGITDGMVALGHLKVAMSAISSIDRGERPLVLAS
jgi:DNA-binding NtrC family response regulator